MSTALVISTILLLLLNSSDKFDFELQEINRFCRHEDYYIRKTSGILLFKTVWRTHKRQLLAALSSSDANLRVKSANVVLQHIVKGTVECDAAVVKAVVDGLYASLDDILLLDRHSRGEDSALTLLGYTLGHSDDKLKQIACDHGILEWIKARDVLFCRGQVRAEEKKHRFPKEIVLLFAIFSIFSMEKLISVGLHNCNGTLESERILSKITYPPTFKATEIETDQLPFLYALI